MPIQSSRLRAILSRCCLFVATAIVPIDVGHVVRAQEPQPNAGDEEKPVQGERRPAPQADPEALGQLLATGAEVRPGGGERLYVRDENGKALVSMLHCAIGDQ